MAEIVDRCRHSTVEQNPLVAALIELHQSGDEDATTVLLSVCRPLIGGLARSATQSLVTASQRREATVAGADTDSRWASLGHVLATIDPTRKPTSIDGAPKVFLAHIASCVDGHRRRLDASTRRHRRYTQRLSPNGRSRLVSLTDELIDAEHHRRYCTDVTAVEDAALHAIELARIAEVVRSGAIDADKWRHLVAHRITPTTSSTTRERVAAHRTARTLARLVDHAA